MSCLEMYCECDCAKCRTGAAHCRKHDNDCHFACGEITITSWSKW